MHSNGTDIQLSLPYEVTEYQPFKPNCSNCHTLP